jgi:Cytochrome D1 heme domain
MPVRYAHTVRRREFLLGLASLGVALDAASEAALAGERRIATPAHPRSIETVAGGTMAICACSEEGVLVLFDASPLRIVAELDVGGEPRYVAAHPDGRHAYVTDAARGQLLIIDLRRRRLIRRLEVGAGARHVTLSPAGDQLWTALGSKAGEIARVDTSDATRPGRLRRTRPVDLAHDVVFTPDGTAVWVSSGSGERVAIHRRGTLRPVRELEGGGPPQHVSMGDGVAYVTSGHDGSLRVHRLRDGRLLRTARVPEYSSNVTAAHGYVVSPSLELGRLAILGPRGHVLRVARVGRSCHDACIVP